MTESTPIALRTIGGPTVIIELAGLRLLVDPTFDQPGSYDRGGGRTLDKTRPPAIDLADIGRVDAVLLSHDQHPDNLDTSGRELLGSAAVTYTTPLAASRLGGTAVGLEAWEERVVVPGADLRLTALPAQHGPDGTEHLTGPVVGFMLHGTGQPTVYVSGDNASLDVVRSIAARFPDVDVAVLFAGAARTDLIPDGPLTITGAQAAEAADVLGRPIVVPVHVDSWAHFSESGEDVRVAFEAAGIGNLLRQPAHGDLLTITVSR